uniref:Kinesin family member 15 n=1 Tax=Oreochromis niloticus TaxID=8128 RepID=A0A669B6Q3_ORENI
MNSSGKGSADSTHLAASSESDSIKVFVRVRPLTRDTGLTTDGDQKLCLSVTSPNTIRLLSKPEPRTFTYDHVADMDTTQDAVFSSVAKNIVESCMNGYNGTIFAYGQTGSGKTFTMLGPSELDNFTDDLRGVIPRSFEYLFFLINREVERSSQSKSFLCKCSFIEIYNEQIYDLLDTASASLFLRENIKKGVFVEGVVEKFVNSAAEAYQVLSMGWRNRRVASTSMNRESSRSHAVFTMTLESKESINEVVNIRMSQLNLVDLAGSERQKDTHTEGSRLKEASSINRSLMCLGQVIMALVDVSNGKNRHICYRDSKLTFLLRDSLGGNAKTYIIANVHPGSKCFGETLSTLQFAQRAKLIKNKAVINEDTQGNVKQLQAEVKKLKEQLAQALTSQGVDYGRDVAPGGPELHMGNNESNIYEEKKALLTKVAQLEEAWAQKDKFIHSSRMIVRFREDHISRLEKKLKAGENSLSDKDSQALIDQLKEEIKILKDQVEHHPKMTRYAAENYSLREENRQLRSLESVVKAQEVAAQVAVEIEEAFQKAVESERPTESKIAIQKLENYKLNAKLLQKQSDLTGALQAFEEYKDVTKKQMAQLESEKRYLEKSNKHLEKILEATNAYNKQEVSELNRIHVETLKVSRCRNDYITIRNNWNKDQLGLQETINNLQQSLQSEQSEIRDLRLVLQSSDKELASVKNKLIDSQSEQQREMSQLSNSLISTQLQLDKVQLEWEQLLEQHRTLQDSFDQLQAEAKFEADQSRQQLDDRQKEIDELKAEIMVSELRGFTRALSENVAMMELLETVEQNTQLKKQVSDLITQNQQQASTLADLEQNLTSAKESIKSLEQKTEQDKVSLVSLIPQIWLLYFYCPSKKCFQVLEIQERELENRRSSMMTMEILLSELNAERAAKNEEIERLKILQLALFSFPFSAIRLQAQESMLVQSQTCIQELTTELRNRCLELRETNQRVVEEEKFIQVKIMCKDCEIEVLRKQNIKLSEENGKLVGHKNHKQRIEYLVKLKKDNTKLQEENEKLRTEISLMRENTGCPPLEINL